MQKSDEPVRRDLRRLAGFLRAISSRILQLPDRKAQVAMGAATNAATSTAFAATITGAIGALGTAGTGTAIAGLSGAAKTSAVLYWIGGIVGGGVAAGSVVLGAGALGAGIYGSLRLRRAIRAQARRRGEISAAELRIVEAASVLSTAIVGSLEAEKEIERRELAMLSRIAVTPLLERVEATLSAGCLDDLTAYNRLRLRGHVNNLRSFQKRLEAYAGHA